MVAKPFERSVTTGHRFAVESVVVCARRLLQSAMDFSTRTFQKQVSDDDLTARNAAPVTFDVISDIATCIGAMCEAAAKLITRLFFERRPQLSQDYNPHILFTHRRPANTLRIVDLVGCFGESF